jgi:hypothetical protein
VAKKRERKQVPGDFYSKETDAPLQAPKWTLGGYKGSLKAAIQEACKYIPGREEPPQEDEPQTADEARTPAPPPAPLVVSDEPRTIPPIIASQTSADEPRVASQSSTDETRTATQPSSDELTQRIRSSLASAKKKKRTKKS